MREMFILSKSAVYLYQVRPDKGKMVLRRTKAVTLLSTQANGRVTQHFSTLVVENGSCSQPSVRLRNYSSCSLPVFLFLALRNFLHMLIGNRLSWQGNCCSPYLLASLPCTFFHLALSSTLTSPSSQPSPRISRRLLCCWIFPPWVCLEMQLQIAFMTSSLRASLSCSALLFSVWKPLCRIFCFFNWSITALQSCVSFCCIMKWIKEMATHSSILAWRIPWTEEPGRLQTMGLQELDTT